MYKYKENDPLIFVVIFVACNENKLSPYGK